MRVVRVGVLLILAATVVFGQAGLSFAQLRDMIRSSIDQGLQDREIAKYLRDQRLKFSLTDALVEDFQGLGAGPRTLDALRKLQEQSRGLPPPAEEAKSRPRGPEQPPPPSEEEQKRIIAEARRSSLEYTRRLPDFVCLQITRRFVDPSGLEMDWLKYDEIKTRVSYVEGHENYEVVSVNNQVVDKGLHELGGATSTGEFGSMLAELFDPGTDAVFKWARHSLLRRHPVYVFSFEVPRHRSRWSLTWRGEGRNEIVTAYKGLVYIDKQSDRVLRITMQAEDIPAAFPIREAGSRLDYDYIALSGVEFLLPLKAQVRMRSGRDLTRNDVEFRLYRKFSADAVITFDEIEDLEPLAEDEAPE